MTLPEGNIDSRACRLRAFWPTLACALAFCAACMLAFLWTPVAYAEGEEASDDQSVEAQNTSIKSQEAPDTQDAIASCVAGLFASWNVQDAPAFYATDMLDVQDGTCMWFAFDAYRAGLTSGADVLLDRAATYVTEAYAGDDKGLDAYAPTTWGRTILVVGTLGGNPTEFGKKPDGSSANLVSDGVFNWSYTDDLGEQGSNAWIYTLQAVDALQLEAPAEAKYSNKDLVEGVLACQAKDGSFALGAGSATGSVDLTGMELAAGKFNFEIVDKDDNDRVVASATNDADGNIAFNPLRFENLGTYHYELRESLNVNNATEEEQALHFDTRTYPLDLVVKELTPGSGSYFIEILSDVPDTFIFHNAVPYTLPETGGTGTLPYTAGGVILITAAVLLPLKCRRKEDAQDS